MNILGISAYYHDSSAALIVGNSVIAAAQEERFSRIKHDNSFPIKACRFCLEFANLKLSDIDVIVFYEKPFVKFERILLTQIKTFPKSFPMFLKGIPIWLKEKLNMRRNLRKRLKEEFGFQHNNIKFVEHHLSHAALAYCASGYNSSDILVVDAVGEWATTSFFKAKGNSIKIVWEQRFPDSIGMFYSAVTQFLGFKVNSDEYKVMGLAPYGKQDDPQTLTYIKLIEENIISFTSNSLPLLNLGYFSFHYGNMMIPVKRWEKLFGIELRKSRTHISQSHKNLALAFQTVTERMLVSILRASKSDEFNLCLSGGVALNCAANGKIFKSDLYENMYVPFAPGDCGCSIGSALAFLLLHNTRISCISSYLGPEYSNDEIRKVLDNKKIKFQFLADPDDLCAEVATLINDGKIIGWFQGRMEVGPRALGNRSILADARRKEMKDMVNARIKFREPFRPFAPSILFEHTTSLMENSVHSPFMMFTFKVKGDRIPAVTHIDRTARVQTVIEDENPLYYKLLTKFYDMTGCPAILNTSFNVMGEPIVCSPGDALNTFFNSGLDNLVMGNFIIKK